MIRPTAKRYRNFRRAYGDHREADARERRTAGIYLVAALAAAVCITLGLGLWVHERSRTGGENAPRGGEGPASAPAGRSAPDSAAAPEGLPEEVLPEEVLIN